MVVDRNGDGVISEADRYLYKSVMAPVTMGFSTRVEWKNFDLGFSLRASLGNYVYNNFEQGQRLKTTSAVWCQSSYLANRSVSSLGWLSDSNTSKLSDYFVQNASFLKMDNITLGYSFDRLFKSGSWKGISGRVYASCSNVFTITKYSGIDPEVSTRVEWKNFDLGFSLRASLGNYVYNNFEQGQRLKTTSAVWCQSSYLANRSVSSLGWLRCQLVLRLPAGLRQERQTA